MLRFAVGAALALVLGATSVASAQAAADQPAVVRKMLMQQDLAISGDYSLALVSVEIPAGGREGRHSHPGVLAVYVQEGVVTLDYEGKPTATYKAGDTFFVEAGKIHEGINRGSVPARAIATFVVPKGQPLTTPAR